METLIIIRVKNEFGNLRRLLEILKQQTYQNFEIVIVNDSSTDGSDKIAFDFFDGKRIKVINLNQKFTYPYACNIGAAEATGKYLVFMSAHSIPFSSTWLADGLSNFREEKVAGVFAYPLANPDTNFFEKIYANPFVYLLHSKRKEYRKAKLGVLGFTNAIIRKDLWSKRNFNQDYIIGGEDTEWAGYWMNKGYVVVQDPKFRVYHSHYLYPLGLVRQTINFFRMLKPSRSKS